MLQALLERPRALAALLVVAGFGAIAVALAAQYWGGLQPCVLCIYQRYAHGAAGAAGLLALLLAARPGRQRAVAAVTGLGGLAFLTCAGIAAFHVGVERLWWRGTSGCHAPALDPSLTIDELREALLDTQFVACDQIPWELFGISIAGYNFLFSLALGAFVLWAVWRQRGRVMVQRTGASAGS